MRPWQDARLRPKNLDPSRLLRIYRQPIKIVAALSHEITEETHDLLNSKFEKDHHTQHHLHHPSPEPSFMFLVQYPFILQKPLESRFSVPLRYFDGRGTSIRGSWENERSCWWGFVRVRYWVEQDGNRSDAERSCRDCGQRILLIPA